MPLIAPQQATVAPQAAAAPPGQSNSAHPDGAPSREIDLSVVILNWNSRDYLVASLDSILSQEWRRDIEVIVVDNASNLDNAVQVVRRDYPQVLLIANRYNVGFAAGNNIGWARSRGKLVLFLNPDTIVHQGALDALVDWMDGHPKAGACGPKLLNSDGTLQSSCRTFPSVGAGFFRNTPLGRLFPNNPWTRSYLMQDFKHDRESPVDWLSGSALLVRREVLNQIGGWDESYFMYCEDVDICYRMKTADWDRYYVPNAIITHRIGGSSDWAQGAMIRRFHASMLRFYFKHYAHGTGILIAPIAIIGVGLRALGAVVKLYYRYFQVGSLQRMVGRRFGKGKKGK